MPPLLAVPNVSQGSDRALLGELQAAFGRGAAILDRHTDADHDRTVFTLAEADGGGLLEPLLAGAAEAVERIDMSSYGGAHPAIGALDVCPVVWLDPADRDRRAGRGGRGRRPRSAASASPSSSTASSPARPGAPSAPTSAAAA